MKLKKPLAIFFALLAASFGSGTPQVFAADTQKALGETVPEIQVPITPTQPGGDFSKNQFELPEDVSLPAIQLPLLGKERVGVRIQKRDELGLNPHPSPLPVRERELEQLSNEESLSHQTSSLTGKSGQGKKISPFLRQFGPASKINFDGSDDAERPALQNVQSNLAAPDISELKQVLADGISVSGRLIQPFSFHLPSGNWTSARDEGLEGFLYSKLELERQGLGNLAQLDDYFRYGETLLSPFVWANGDRKELEAIRSSNQTPAEKNASLNAWLIRVVSDYQGRLKRLDSTLWTRQSSTYMVFSRAYNRLKPGKNFFDSIDETELSRVRDEIKADSLWLMDIFEIGDVHRWGTGGGSSYSIKGYRVKPELGGDAGFKSLVLRAQAMGLKVGVDFIPNHVSLDSDFINEFPEGVIHIVPPQDLSDEEIMAQAPRHNGLPVFYLLHTDNYPENGVRVKKKILVQYPMTDYGGDMWTDLAQMDYSRPETRQWELDQTLKMFGPWGLNFVRRDMAYEILNARYFPRWMAILQNERDQSSGWMRQSLSQFIEDFQSRWKTLNGAEFMAEMAKTARQAKPSAGLYDEAYSNFSDLSRAGSSAVYNKSDHDQGRGQYGLYDGMVAASYGGNVDWLREALKNVAFRMWQQGGATELNFIGTHDGGEGNPIDKFGHYFKAAALTALLFRPILVYNGVEQGVGQVRNLIGDLSKSQDTQKAIPFDIPVLINWAQSDPGNQEYLKKLWIEGEKHKDFIGKALEVLTPKTSTSILAWAAGHKDNGVQKALIGAANFGQRTGTFFNMDSPVLDAFGAFKPRADRDYILSDVINTQKDGSPTIYRRSGAELLKNGLYISLDAGGTQLFEVEEVAPAPKSEVDLPGASSQPLPRASHWDQLTQRFVKISWGVFGLLQLPQVWDNIANLSSGHAAALSGIPFIGILSGILADGMLMSYFTGQKEYSPAIVQTIGVVMATVVLSQIAWAGFVPLAVYFTTLPLVVTHLVLNALKWRGKLPEKIAGIPLWDFWQKGLSLLGLALLPAGMSAMFAASGAATVGLPLALGGVAALAGLGVMIAASRGKLSPKWAGHWATLGAWLATGLFMFMPLAQIKSIFINPIGLHGLALPTFFMGAMGNLLMLPRAIFTQNKIWLIGSGWAVLVGGLAVFLSLALHGVVGAWAYLGASFLAAVAFMGYAIKRNHKRSQGSS